MKKGMARRGGGEGGQQIDLTPMLDVVFIMLIFFIVTSSFIKEPGIDVQRPGTDTHDIVANQNILVAITSENKVWINKEEVKPAAIKNKIQAIHAENPKGALVIQADFKSNAESYALVYDAAKDAGVEKISLSSVDK